MLMHIKRAYKASIAIRIMSDTRDEEQVQRWRERQDRGVLQDAQDLTVTYNTGNIINSIIPVLYQCIVTCMHEINYAIVLRIILYPWYQDTRA